MQVSIWERETWFSPQDIIIIGSGFTGLWSAFHFIRKHPKMKITIVERGVIPTGASTRNAGFACFGSLSEVVYDAHTMGADKTLALLEMRFKGLGEIQKHFSDKEIDFELTGGYELYETDNKTSSEELLHNIEYINSLVKPITDTKNTYKLTDEGIDAFGFGNTRHLVKNKLEGALHSGKLLQALLKNVQKNGVQIFNHTDIKRFHSNDNGIELETSHGFTLSAKKILICTNAFTKDLLPETDIIPARGQVLLTSPISNLSFKGTFHSDEGFYYFRNLGDRVLLGGARNKAFEEERTTEMQTSNFIQTELERFLDEVVLPNHRGQYTIDRRWAGIMAMGSEKYPIVKEIQPNIFCAVRMSGMGVALAPIVSKQVMKMME
jgi:glycine/D-amino acid oxidase-like deaminating enzyme